MLVVFVLDTSASMNQRCSNGLSLLDCAKSAIEQFHKVRLRDASIRTDKYMLVTCERGSNVIQVLDKFPFSKFLQVVKGIQAQDLTTIDTSLQQVFNFLHLQRLTLDIDKFGQGRNLYSIDPTTIILLTDGCELTSKSGTLSHFSIASPQTPIGADLCTHPFRWDQRVFAFLLRIPAVSTLQFEKDENFPSNIMDNAISKVCDWTGGKYFIATNWKALLQHIEATALRLLNVVIVSFEQATAPGSSFIPQGTVSFKQKVVFIRPGQGQGFWPIPESFFPDIAHPELPPREPHPMICYKPIDADPFIPANFIYDKYEIENIPFMSLSNKASKGVCWQVFIRNSKGSEHGLGEPFGFIRFNHGGPLSLYVLPYNYPVLWQLLKQVVKVPGSTMAKIPYGPQWRQEMEHYLAGVPPYYGPALRTALKKWGIHTQLVPDSMDSSWFAFLGSHHKKIKAQAKVDYDQAMSQIITDDQLIAKMSLHDRSVPIHDQVSSQTYDVLSGFVTSSATAVQSPLIQVGSKTSLLMNSSRRGCIFKNPFDIPKDQLIRQIINLPIRVSAAIQKNKNFDLCKIDSPFNMVFAKMTAREAVEAKHSVPLEKMGDFSDTLLKQQLPRNPYIEEKERNRQQKTMFGNPFRLEKNEGAEETWQEGINGPPARGRRKRRKIEHTESSGITFVSDGTLDGTVNNEVAPRNKMMMETDLLTSKEPRAASLSLVNDIHSRGSVEVVNMDAEEMKEKEQISEALIHKDQQDRSSNDSFDNVQASQENAVAESNVCKDTHHVADFLISIIRILRHTQAGQTTKLFEILSVPSFPVEKCSFVKQLIQQAYLYNKWGVAEELSNFHQVISQIDSAVGKG